MIIQGCFNSVNGQKVTGQKVTILIGQKVTNHYFNTNAGRFVLGRFDLGRDVSYRIVGTFRTNRFIMVRCFIFFVGIFLYPFR